MIRFIGCLHLGDKRLTTGIRNLSSSDEHDVRLENNWNSVVTDEDIVYILGDISMEDPSQYKKLEKLKGKKIVVMGNHDLFEHSKQLIKYVDGLCGMKYIECYEYNEHLKIWLTHAPLHPQELSFVDINIHAHIHHMEVPETAIISNYWGEKKLIYSKQGQGYINVDAHIIDYKPKTLLELLNNNNIVHRIEI